MHEAAMPRRGELQVVGGGQDGGGAEGPKQVRSHSQESWNYGAQAQHFFGRNFWYAGSRWQPAGSLLLHGHWPQ
jgi:hypothetical protein